MRGNKKKPIYEYQVYLLLIICVRLKQMDVDHELLDLLNNLCNVYTIKEIKKKHVLGCLKNIFTCKWTNEMFTQLKWVLNSI